MGTEFYSLNKKVNLFGNEGYAHIVLDPERKGRETKKLLINAIEDKESDDENIEFELLKSGAMILVSSFEIKRNEVVPLYYMRQTVEKLIGFAKDVISTLFWLNMKTNVTFYDS